MKTLHRIKTLPLGVFTVIVLTFPLLSLAAPWSEQNAFCLDRVAYSGSYSNYSNQKIYNECMDNADALIAKSEKSSRDFWISWNKGKIEQQKKHRELQLDALKIREAEIKREKRKNEQEIKKYDDLFSEFDN